MENIVNKILEIDLEAQKRLEEAIEKKNSIISSANSKDGEIKRNILKRAEDRLKKVEAFNKQNSDEIIEKINLDTKGKIDKLNKIYETYCKQWEENILNSIIGV